VLALLLRVSRHPATLIVSFAERSESEIHHIRVARLARLVHSLVCTVGAYNTHRDDGGGDDATGHGGGAGRAALLDRTTGSGGAGRVLVLVPWCGCCWGGSGRDDSDAREYYNKNITSNTGGEIARYNANLQQS